MIKIEVGQVWKRKAADGQQICIVSVNRGRELVMVTGLSDITENMLTIQYLKDCFQLMPGWDTRTMYVL